MATMLGKRKRWTTKDTEANRQDEEDLESFERNAHEIFRRHFEAQFKPLPQIEQPVKGLEQQVEGESEDDSEWDGISDREQTSVQVVEHTSKESQIATMSKVELKSYMVKLYALPNLSLLTRKQELKPTQGDI
jgi:hypothetical protein